MSWPANSGGRGTGGGGGAGPLRAPAALLMVADGGQFVLCRFLQRQAARFGVDLDGLLWSDGSLVYDRNAALLSLLFLLEVV